MTSQTKNQLSAWCSIILCLGLIGKPFETKAQCNLVCNNLVNASMPSIGCSRFFEADDFIESPEVCDFINFEVTIVHPFGTHALAGNLVDRSHLGYTMVYRVTDPLTDNSCWGYLKVEDKSAPQAGCFNRTISCFEVIELNALLNEVIDNCSVSAKVVLENLEFNDLGCDDTAGIGLVYRRIRTSDSWGNSALCSDTLTILRDSLDNITCPEIIELNCKSVCYKVNANGTLPEATTDILFSSKKGDPNYPSPEFLLEMQNPKKWRDAINDDQPCLAVGVKIVPELCLSVTSNALNFDGADDFVESLVDVSEEGFTVEFWFRTTSADCGLFSVSNDILGAGGYDRIIYLSAGNIFAHVYNGPPDATLISTTGTNYADGAWHHLAYVIGASAGGNRLYLDGTLAAHATKDISDFYWQDRITIGYVPSAFNPYFEGDMDEFRVWSVARTVSQIQANRNTEIIAQPNLQVYYKFNQGTAGGNNAGIDAAEDASGNNYTGGLNNFSLSGPTSNWVTGNTFLTNCVPIYPAVGGFCKTAVSYKDELFPICQGDGSFKIRREWLIYDWCSGEEKICIQYIIVKDRDAPELVLFNGGTGPLDDRLAYTVYTGPHDCYAFVDLKELITDDCSQVTQSYSISYEDISHPGKIITKTGKIPGRISLPPVPGIYGRRTFFVDATLVDACYNRTALTIEVNVLDDSPPNPVCDENTQVTVDPTTCWARVYAKDLDNGSRDNCCDVLHFAIARMDSVEATRKYIIDEVIAQCGNAVYWASKEQYDYYAEDYINSYIFSDYLDLTTCGSVQIVLRVWEACGVPRYDPHVWPCSEHHWFLYNIGDSDSKYRADHNLNFGFAPGADYTKFTAPKDCNWRYPLAFCDPIAEDWFALAGTDDTEPHYDGAAASDICNFDFYFPVTEFRNIASTLNAYPPGNTCARFLYADCMINILVDDKTPPVCESPEELFWYCDDAGGVQASNRFQFAWTYCEDSYTYDGKLVNFNDYRCEDASSRPYNEIECETENDGVNSDAFDKTGKSFGWYGCNIYGNSHVDEHGNNSSECNTSTYISSPANEGTSENTQASVNNSYGWAPVYCHRWLCADKYDSAGKIDPKTRFYTPVFRVGDRGEDPEPGTFIIWDNCILPTATSKDEQYIDQCGKGWLKRTWTINSNCSNTPITCSQKIITAHRSDFEVVLPADLIVSCNAAESLLPETTGKPEVMDDECELVAMNYTDQRFDIVGDACYKIVRTWTLIDWCIYDPATANNSRYPEVIVDDRLVADTLNRYCVYRNLKDAGDGIITYTQIIKVVDLETPVAGIIADTTFCIQEGYNGAGPESDPMCKASVYQSSEFTATDNCTASGLISFRWELDLDAVGTSYQKSQINIIGPPQTKKFVSADLIAGIHRLYVIAEDNCGNEDTTSFQITVKDCKKPTPYCYNGIATVIMPSTGTITVWAKDLDAGSYDNCTKKAELVFSFDQTGLELSRTYSCDSVPNGIGSTKVVQIYVWDKAGNRDFCETYLLIQDGSGNACPDLAGIEGSISGKITTQSQEPVEHVVLTNKSGSGSLPAFKTALNGNYSFGSLPMQNQYTIQPNRNDDPINGVTTLDLVLIQKHILGMESLSSPYNMIAADADHNNEISALDLIALRKLILTIYDALPDNNSWRFVPKSFVFPEPSNPWKSGTGNTSGGFPEAIEIQKLGNDELHQDFIAIKVGDVNSTAIPHSLMGTESRENTADLKLFIDDRILKPGDLATIEFYSPNFNQIEGFQFSLSVSGLELKGIKPGRIQVNETNFGLNRLKDGYLTASWNDNKSISIKPNEVLFSLEIKATKSVRLGEILSLNSKFTRSEAYHTSKPIGIQLSVGRAVEKTYALHQNIPNPFKSTTVIGYELAANESVTVQITDVTGKIISKYQLQGNRGYNQFRLEPSEIFHAGVYYYTLETKNFKATKKMIVVD